MQLKKGEMFSVYIFLLMLLYYLVIPVKEHSRPLLIGPLLHPVVKVYL